MAQIHFLGSRGYRYIVAEGSGGYGVQESLSVHDIDGRTFFVATLFIEGERLSKGQTRQIGLFGGKRLALAWAERVWTIDARCKVEGSR